MIKRSHFSSRTLAYLLIAPQILVTLTFFYWPAAQGLLQSVMISDPFGQRSQFVWFYNFINIFTDPLYLKSIGITLGFSLATASPASSSACSSPPWPTVPCGPRP
jgi:sn-glycerol 3-phosphate transport system permease protein